MGDHPREWGIIPGPGGLSQNMRDHPRGWGIIPAPGGSSHGIEDHPGHRASSQGEGDPQM